jgi:hypothetical protein
MYKEKNKEKISYEFIEDKKFLKHYFTELFNKFMDYSHFYENSIIQLDKILKNLYIIL